MKRITLCLLFASTTGCAAIQTGFRDFANGFLYGVPAYYSPSGTPVYAPGECIGAVVNGVCHGSVIDTMPNRPRCHGTMINGQCTGRSSKEGNQCLPNP
jgi:hypothetical protein